MAMTISIRNSSPSQLLLNQVKGAFIAHGTTLTEWCNNNGIRYQNARQYLLGLRNGRKAQEWRQRIVEAAQQVE
jgi:hypothetical protein